MKTVLITGANRGIGLALAKLLQARGEKVIGVCRNSSSELEAVAERVIEGIDVGNDACIEALADGLGEQPLDWAILNAGILRSESLEKLDFASMRSQFEVNSLGPLRCITAIGGQLSKGSKVGIVTSRMGSVADNTSGGYYGYRMSKAAVNMAGMSLAHDLKPRGIMCALLHPGFVRTEMVC